MPNLKNHEISRRLDENIIAGYYTIPENSKAFIASGDEVAFSYMIVGGDCRIDGKAVVGEILILGTLKVEGTLETESIFE